MQKVVNKYIKPEDKILVVSQNKTDAKLVADSSTLITSIDAYNNEEFDVAILVFQPLDVIKKFINSIASLPDKRLILKVKKDFDFQTFIRFLNWSSLDIYSKKSEQCYIVVTRSKSDISGLSLGKNARSSLQPAADSDLL